MELHTLHIVYSILILLIEPVETPEAPADGSIIYPVPVDVTMTDFAHHKWLNKGWYSPPFLTHKDGYQMCVRVKANGEGEGVSTHLSLFVHLMAGKYDKILTWPFVGAVTVQLRNQKGDYNHLERTIQMDESVNESIKLGQVRSGQPTSTGGVAAREGQGIAMFIPLKHLEYNEEKGTHYLKDDTLIFRIQKAFVYSPHTISGPSLEQQPPLAELELKPFSKYKRKEKWKSKPFYSGEGGYRFILTALPYGQFRYEGKAVSVYAHIVRGENDDKLKFPFIGTVTVQMVNWLEDRNHVEKMIAFTDDHPGEEVGSSNVLGRSEGYGYHNFLLHEGLGYNEKRYTQYLKDDAIKLRVVSIDARTR